MRELLNKEKKPSSSEQKDTQLTPQELQRRRKILIYPLFILLFIGCMWLIFAPSSQKEQEDISGLNTVLPDPALNKGSIISDKREAYIQEELEEKEREKNRSLQDFVFLEETPEERQKDISRQKHITPTPIEYFNAASHYDKPNAFRSSASAYKDINRQLGSFYETSKDNDQQKELQKRIEELERQLEERQARQSNEDEHLKMIEKSYEIASRYMSSMNNMEGSAPMNTNQSISANIPIRKAQPIGKVQHNVVSFLTANPPDSMVKKEYVKPRNQGFITITKNEIPQDKNGIRGSIYQTITVTDGGYVTLRLTDPIRVGNYIIPDNTLINGIAHVSGERLLVTVNAIRHEDNIIPVELKVYDFDGNEGIYIPGSDEISAAKEIASTMGSGLGSSLSINDNAGSQLLSDLGRGTIQGISQYIGKKVKKVKITLKEGHQVLLLPKE